MNEEKNILAIRINQLRKDSNLTQEELALKLGLKGKSSIANYESGKITPSDDIKLKMCELFNCTMDYLMGESNFRNINETISNYKQEQYKKDVINALARSTALFLKSGADVEHINKIKEILLSSDTEKQKGDKLGDLYNNFSFNKPEFKNAIISILDYITDVDEDRKYYNSLMTLKNNLVEDKSKINNKSFYPCPVYGKISAGQPNWAEECLEGYLPIDPNLMNIVNPEECFFLRVDGESMNKIIKNGAYALIRKTDFVDDGEIAVVLVNGYDATIKKFTKQGDFIVLEPMSDDPSIKTQIYTKDTSIKVIGRYIGKMEMNS